MSQHTSSLDGTLHLLPFTGGSLATRIADIYTTALDTADTSPRDILVLKRLPNGIPDFTATLREQTDLQTRPQVTSLTRHATSVLTEAQPNKTVLSYEERIEFLARVLDGYNWSAYFEDASSHDSFGRDVGQLLLDATWQGGFDSPAEGTEYDQYLRELADVNASFHDALAQRGVVERAQTLSQAIDALERTAVREQIEREFDVVIVAEFEECTAIDRAYLATLTRNADLICVAEAHASIQRIKTEAGSVRQLADGLTVHDRTEDDHSNPEPGREMVGHSFGQFLATGDCNRASTARLIESKTFSQQVEAVANEIEYLRQEHGWAYDEFAVGVRRVGEQLTRARRILRQAGVPTVAAGVTGLEQDLAVRELHALATYHIDGQEQAFELLTARIPDLDVEQIQACVVPNSIAKSLKRWIVATDLKRRIAEGSSDIDAREQFQNIARLLSIAEFVDSQDILPSDWAGFLTMLERAITYDASYTHTADVAVPNGGVTVGEIGLLKNQSRKAVFLLTVVDAEYPGSESLSPLFPTAWIKQMTGYPAVTQPSEADVTETYATVSGTAGNEFERYHNERTRRHLAIGARAAEEQLYFCTAQQTDGGTGRLQHRSRYLHAIADHPTLALEDIGGAGVDRDIHTLGSASAEILAQPWGELERIQAEASTGGDVTLESAKATLAEIQQVVAESDTVDPRFERAVETQFDFARGAIRPDEPADAADHGGED